MTHNGLQLYAVVAFINFHFTFAQMPIKDMLINIHSKATIA